MNEMLQKEEQYAGWEDLDVSFECSGVMNSTTISNSTTNQSANRSGLVQSTKSVTTVDVQTEPVKPDKLKLRVKRKICTDKIKATCANASSVCGVSVKMSQQAVKTVCKELYEHVYLSAAELANQLLWSNHHLKNDAHQRVPEIMKAMSMFCLLQELPDYKQMQASQVEQDAAVALWNKDENVKSTLNHDTTTGNTIDGEWPAIILYFSNVDEYVLRSYEDREQIAELLEETYPRLSVAPSVDKPENITPAVLWEKTDAIMTDSVSKNLKIEDLIGESLGSDHWPYHLLCKSHTVVMLDATNLKVLATTEKSVKQRELFESIDPSLRSFFPGKKTDIEAGIDTLMTLVSCDKPGISYSQAELFDLICERQDVQKRLFLYQQRRFPKLGKSAAASVEG